MSFSKNAIDLIRARYAHRGESVEDVFRRVAKAISVRDEKFENELYQAMTSGVFLPNSPAIRNAGKKKGCLSACFVIPIEDSISSIYQTLTYMALIFQRGGGIGIDFTPLRPKGSHLSSGGTSSGAVSFMDIFDATTEVVKAGGFRRGASLLGLRYNHVDIEDFCQAKLKGKLTNANLSVIVTDDFMKKATSKNGKIDLVHEGKVYRSVSASNILDLMAYGTWVRGDPGILFFDRMNKDNPKYPEQIISVTNPCGEVPLPPWGACCLGSVNISKFVEGDDFNKDKFADALRLATRALLNINTINVYPLPQIHKVMHELNSVGVGVMGFCYSDDTEILTDKGWKLFKDLDKTEKVATLNTETNVMEYQKPLMYYKLPYKGSLFHYDMGYYTDLLVTPNHKLYLKDGYSRKLNFSFKTELERASKWGIFKRDFKWQGIRKDFVLGSRTYKAEDYMEFMGWFLSEGFTTTQNRIGISQSRQSNYNKNIKSILNRMGFRYSHCKHEYIFRDQEWYNYLKQFGKASDKFVPNFIKESTSDLITIFLKTFAKGDGCKQNKSYRLYSSSKKLIDDLQELIFKSGGTGSVQKRVRERVRDIKTGRKLSTVKHETCYEVSWILKNGKEFEFHGRPKVIDYEGYVYDVTVPKYHTLFVRRNGKPIWSSNSDALIMLGVYYDSEDCLKFIEEIGKVYREVTDECAPDSFYRRSIAPTGSLSILADCSSGIEPVFAKSFDRHLTHGIVPEERPIYKSKYCRTAHEIDPDWHLAVQAKWQQMVDAGVSKTINCPGSTTVEDIRKLYIKAWKAGVKGITIFRDQSIDGVLKAKEKCEDGICTL